MLSLTAGEGAPAVHGYLDAPTPGVSQDAPPPPDVRQGDQGRHAGHPCGADDDRRLGVVRDHRGERAAREVGDIDHADTVLVATDVDKRR